MTVRLVAKDSFSINTVLLTEPVKMAVMLTTGDQLVYHVAQTVTLHPLQVQRNVPRQMEYVHLGAETGLTVFIAKKLVQASVEMMLVTEQMENVSRHVTEVIMGSIVTTPAAITA